MVIYCYWCIACDIICNCSDSYHHALKRVKITESRSDLSAESCDDRETHHQRCLINMSTDDTVAFSVKSGKQRSRRDDAGSAVSMPFVPIPSGLQQSYLAPIGMLNF